MTNEFIAGLGCAAFVIYGWQVVYELVRHRSMLEFRTPEVSREFVVFSLIGLGLWVFGAFV